MTSAIRIYLILLWKKWKETMSRWIVYIIVAIIIPVSIFLLLFLAWNYLDLNTAEMSEIAENQEPMMSLDSYTFVKSPKLIMYTPDSPVSNLLMDEVGRRLRLPRLAAFDHNARGYYSFPNGTLDLNFFFVSSMKETTALVIFNDMDSVNVSWPQNLKYTIRMKNPGILKPELVDIAKVGARSGMNYEPFMRLQWAIDSSFLKLTSGEDVNPTVLLQALPLGDPKPFNPIGAALIIFGINFSLICTVHEIVAAQITERASGLFELMRMSGVSRWTWGAAELTSAFPRGAWYSLVGALVITMSPVPLMPNTSIFLFFIALLLYYYSVVCFSMAVGYIICSVSFGPILAILLFILFTFPDSYIQSDKLSPIPVYVLSLTLHFPVCRFVGEAVKLEEKGRGLTFSNMLEKHAALSAAACLVFLIIQSGLYLLLALYLSYVRPGPYGMALPWNFCLGQDKPVLLVDGSEVPEPREEKYFEAPPEGLQPGIIINNVSKFFGTFRSLWNVSFEVYRGEITVLLGHNGAGKTTLMSIITGVISPTAGAVYIKGQKVTAGSGGIHGLVGFCPQHNILFPRLSVRSHALFFALLSGQSYQQANLLANKLVELVGLKKAANLTTKQLSGGMLRRAQLVCALAGGADVLVLDEPTSGLDVETRRELWDLLLALRGERTVLLSTHFMEEADALGDRVAALHSGTLRCYATPMHLKQNIGSGYRLTLVTNDQPQFEDITALVTKAIPGAALKGQTYNTVVYELPAQQIQNFSALFSELEAKRSDLGLESLGVGMATLEEVFLKLCSDSNILLDEDEEEFAEQEFSSAQNRLTGLPLKFRQFVALLKRPLRHILDHKISFLIFQIGLPLLMLTMFSLPIPDDDEGKKSENNTVMMDFDAIYGRPERRVMYSGMDDNATKVFRSVLSRYKTVRFTEAAGGDVADAVLRAHERDKKDKYIAGVELNNTHAKVWYSKDDRHAGPAAVNLLSNVLAALRPRPADSARPRPVLATADAPLTQEEALEDLKFKEPKDFAMICAMMLFLLLIIFVTQTGVMAFMSTEVRHGTRHLLRMAGCAALTLFASELAFFVPLYTITIVTPTTLLCLLDDKQTTNQPDFMGVFFFILLLGTISVITTCYLVSCAGLGWAGRLIVLVYFFLSGICSGFPYSIAEGLATQLAPIPNFIVTVNSYLSPAHNFVAACMKSARAVSLRAWCTLNRDNPIFCAVTIRYGGYAVNVQDRAAFDGHKCCVENKPPMDYFAFSKYSAGKETLLLFLQTVVLVVLIWLQGRGLLSCLSTRITAICSKPLVYVTGSERVEKEKIYVDKTIVLPADQIPDALLVHDAHKDFCRCLRPTEPAQIIKGINISVKKGECFGLLGVNGAGKSTTFKLITAQCCPTKGKIFSNGYFFNKPRQKYLETLSYCPQFFGLDTFLTGRQALELALAVRGVRADAARRAAAAWLAVVGLERHADARARGYSGGCQRRLAAAAALCGGAPAALLDEPTSGVDVGARRRVWAALRRGLRGGRAVLITSHSMDEMEALCQRIAIMAHGRVVALGSAAQLRADHSKGHALNVKLRGQDDARRQESLAQLNDYLNKKFNITLRDEHKTVLSYHINERVPYSALFATLEEMRGQFRDFVEDYSVTETTLEEVFLSFAHVEH